MHTRAISEGNLWSGLGILSDRQKAGCTGTENVWVLCLVLGQENCLYIYSKFIQALVITLFTVCSDVSDYIVLFCLLESFSPWLVP